MSIAQTVEEYRTQTVPALAGGADRLNRQIVFIYSRGEEVLGAAGGKISDSDAAEAEVIDLLIRLVYEAAVNNSDHVWVWTPTEFEPGVEHYLNEVISVAPAGLVTRI